MPELLEALAARLGPVQRVSYHHGDWSSAPRHTVLAGNDVAVDADAESAHTVTFFGRDFGRMTLLVVPPYTDPGEAYGIVITASSADDASTPDQLLGISPPRHKERKLAPLAIHRWETEGGSLNALPSGPAVSALRIT